MLTGIGKGWHMSCLPAHMTHALWMRHLFSSQAARDGGVVRRKVSDVARIVGCAAFEAEIRRRGYRAIRNGNTYVVFCNNEALHLIG